jgi:hypothetical protein
MLLTNIIVKRVPIPLYSERNSLFQLYGLPFF